MNLLCGLRAKAKRKEDKMTPETKKLVRQRMIDVARDWTGTDPGADKLRFQNSRDGNWNTNSNFKDIFLKYTKKDFSLSDEPITLSDVRKFEIGLKYFDKLIARKDGPIWAQFHLPRAAMENIPELKRFQDGIISESSFFRNYTNETSRQVNDMLSKVKDLGLTMGASIVEKSNFSSGGAKRLRKLNDEYSFLVKAIKQSKSSLERSRLNARLVKNRQELTDFHSKGQGQAFLILTDVLQGVDIETIKWKDHLGKERPIDSNQKSILYDIRKNYNFVRAAGVKSLTRGLEKVRQMAAAKDLGWATPIIDRVNGLIKAIEFQKRIDQEGKTIDHKYMIEDRQFKELGFKPDLTTEPQSHPDRKVAFSKHYMTKYTLGLLETVKKIRNEVEEGNLTLDKKIEAEIGEFESIVNVAKPKNPVMDVQWDNDPYFFLKKYTSDVGLFNYKTHVKDTFSKGSQAIIKEHLKPAREKGREDIAESAESMLEVMRSVWKEASNIEKQPDTLVNDVQRIMTAFTYFRLMGGNVRSAARNGTQRLYEFVEFGFKASMFDAPNFYKQVGGAKDNVSKVTRWLREYGLQWYDGKSKASNAWDALTKSEMTVSEQSRGALDDAYLNNRQLYVDKNGELQSRGGETRTLEPVAAVAGNVAKKFGFMHKLVEDWNRSGTFRTAFALANMNLSNSNRTWLARKVLSPKDIAKIRESKGEDHQVTYKDFQEKYGAKHEEVLENWIDKTSAQIAYNSVLDLHFEYSKWAKAKIIRAEKGEAALTQFTKTAIGQFSHYRFNMFNLMHRWVKEAGISLGAGDFTSQEVWRALRFGLLQTMIVGGSIAARTNFVKLIPNDVFETGEAMWYWQTVNREKLLKGEASKEALEALDKATYGQGGQYFLGPNFQYLASAVELMNLYDVIGKNPATQVKEGMGFNGEWGSNAFELSAKKALRDPELQRNYEWWAKINSQFARTYNYTSTMFTKAGGLKDAGALEFGLFPSKWQRKWSDEFYQWLGFKTKKKRKKKFTGVTESKKRDVLSALDNIRALR
tara:strand:- start:3538 stop:6633 length:3096 start_codon:yes stop_codon:yes gene_type:complete